MSAGRLVLLFGEDQAPPIFCQIDIDGVTGLNLSAGDQTRERKNKMTLDRTLERTCPVFRIRPFTEKEFFCICRAKKIKKALRLA